ncbi:hypothetical protein MMC30_003354 [Trapelia coarctata]|nr:hypothetical protein [Trapelia coarctata]
MLQIRRSTIRLAQKTRLRPQRRQETTSHAASAGHAGPPHSSHHPEPVNESFGRGFYITLAFLPLSFALYKFSRSTNDSKEPAAQPLFTRMLQSYSEYKGRWTERNTLHTRMVEQAANDRNLFQSTPGTRMIDLKFPEVFNSGSPYNVQAGQTANLDALFAHYEKKNREDEEKFQRKREARARGESVGT